MSTNHVKGVVFCLALLLVQSAAGALAPPAHFDAKDIQQPGKGGSMANTSGDLATLAALNQDYIDSVQRSDVRRFSEILADDFLCSLPDGSLVDRAAFLEQTAKPVTIRNLQAHDVNIRLMGDVAIVHARTTYTTADGRAASGRYTDVWARRNGQWLAVSAHVTRN
jgi:ketosteroid isomerase-like protein